MHARGELFFLRLQEVKRTAGFFTEEVQRDEKNIPAEKTPAAEGAWLHEENEHGKWTQSAQEKTRKRENPALLLIKPIRFKKTRRRPIGNRLPLAGRRVFGFITA